MIAKSVPIRYGLPADFPPELSDLGRREFPNSHKWVMGGCMVDREQTAILWCCPECERAEQAWSKAREQAERQRLADPPPPPPLPAAVDLRPRLLALGLPPRPQGARGTCSIFTTCEAIEFALGSHAEHATRLSPEFLNWAAGQAAGRPSDGNFFHNALNGFERYGICRAESMPYSPRFDAAAAPSERAMSEAMRIRDSARAGGPILIHWIVPWQSAHFGVNDEQFAEIKRVLASGSPVAAGSGHSRLLVGYRDDPSQPGGGRFITEDSALNRFDEVTYEFVRGQVADVFWIEAVEASTTRTDR
jgi:hypothetical protein